MCYEWYPAVRAITSGEFPILAPSLRFGELVATLALAQDIQHIYNKIGVSTRAAAALWAMQYAVVC